MDFPILSIIIPMYKVESYVKECIDSIVNQDVKERIEIILINDGSPDRCEEIGHDYVVRDSRISLFSQPNRGLSVARNLGLKKATGKYIWFIDSDDWVSSESINTILDIIKINTPEAIHICGADVKEGLSKTLFSLKQCEGKIMTGLDMLTKGYFHGVVQYTIYEREFLINNNLSFMEGIYHEDTEFSPRAYYNIRKIISIDKVLYLKRINEDSITRTVNSKKNHDLIKVSRSLRCFAMGITDKNARKFFMRLSGNALKMAMRNEFDRMDKETIKSINQDLKLNEDLLNSFFESDRILYTIQGSILKLFPNSILTMYNMVFENKLLKRIFGSK